MNRNLQEEEEHETYTPYNISVVRPALTRGVMGAAGDPWASHPYLRLGLYARGTALGSCYCAAPLCGHSMIHTSSRGLLPPHRGERGL